MEKQYIVHVREGIINVLENDNVAIYLTYNAGMPITLAKGKPSIIVAWGASNPIPHTVDEAIDLIAAKSDGWEAAVRLAQEAGNVSRIGGLKQYYQGGYRLMEPKEVQELVRRIPGVGRVEGGYPADPVALLMCQYAHYSPDNAIVWGIEDVIENIFLPGSLGVGGTVVCNHGQETRQMGKAIAVFAALEAFYKDRLGYAESWLSGGQKSPPIQLTPGMTEQEVEQLVKQRVGRPDLIEEGIWRGLKTLFPDYKERLERILAFDRDFAPTEFERTLESYRLGREWLRSLKGGD
jgi:hypothetical protein